MKKNIGAIIQARMGSTRLPEKIFRKLNNKTVLEHIYNRVKDSTVDKVVIATTNNRSDDIVEEFCKKKLYPYYRGSEDDVLERFYFAAKQFGIDIIVRVTADDPLKDTEVVNKAISIMLNNNYDYVSNTIEPTYPEGIDIEVFSFKALERAYNEAKLKSEHEHVTPYIWKNDDKFKIYNMKNDIDLSGLRWTMDTEDDYNFMKEVYSFFKDVDNFSMEDVLKILEKHPKLSEINMGHIRNEGYLRSVKEDKNEL